MKFNDIGRTNGKQGTVKTAAVNAFIGAGLMVAGLAMVPAAQNNEHAKKNGIEIVTISDSTVTVRSGDKVAGIEFLYDRPAYVTWKVAKVDSNGIQLAYEMKGIFGADTLRSQDSATVAFGQDTVIGKGTAPIRINVAKGADSNSAVVTVAFQK
jgi:hypothetical protein